jgi:aryl-alcohol dehydrogenase-like predicted oxidoreductase
MRTRQVGGTGQSVGAVGLGCMGMSGVYGEAGRDDNASVAVIHEALDAGCTLIDTADVYGAGHNEELVGRALRDRRDEAFLATKCGLVVDSGAPGPARDGSPGHLREAVDSSLRRLHTDVIDLYYLHRVDDATPLQDSWGTMSEFVGQGKVRYLGLSEVTTEQAVQAADIHPVTAIQSEMSLWTRDAADVAAWCRENGAAFVPFSPLGRGFLTGTVQVDALEDGDFRTRNPRFAAEAARANQRIVDTVRAVADRRSATPAQVALAWVLARGDHVIPIPGTKRSTYLRENLAAADLGLSDDDLSELDNLPAPVGARY